MHAERNNLTKRYSAILVFVIAGIGRRLAQCSNAARAVRFCRRDRPRCCLCPRLRPRASTHWIGQQTGWIFHGRSAFSDKVRLEARVAELEAENVRLREAQIKYEQLRDDLKFVRTLPLLWWPPKSGAAGPIRNSIP